MHPNEYEKLCNLEGEYLSIAITDDDIKRNVYPVLWRRTATAYNMKLPRLYLAKEDLEDQEIMNRIKSFKVNGCYIFCPLESYDFLRDFPDMYDLTIHNAFSLRDLSFLKSFKELRMLLLSKAHLPNIDEVLGQTLRFLARPRYLALYDCVIDDISLLEQNRVSFGELVIYNPKDRNEHDRWLNAVRDARYYEIKDK